MNKQADLEAMFSPAALQNPYPLYAHARRHGQVVVMPEWGNTFVFGWEANQSLFKHPQAHADRMSQVPNDWFGARLLKPMMLFHDGVSHTRLRGLVAQAFTPRAIAESRDAIGLLCNELLFAHAKTGGDFLSNVAIPLPMLVIAKLLGIDKVDKTAFRHWADALVVILDGGGVNENSNLLEQHIQEMLEYFDHTATDLKLQNAPGVLGAMARAEADGERLSRAELLSNAALLLAAGFETTTNLIAGALLEFSHSPDQWQRLQQSPDLIPNAVEECLRVVTPVQATSRHLVADVSWQEQTLASNTGLSLMLGAANRDPEKFSNPDQFDIARANASQHLSFASGAHYCLGAPLARLEMQVFLQQLLQHFARFRVPEQNLEYRPNFSIRGLSGLLIELQ